METDLWSSRMASKRTQLLQASQFLLDRQLNNDDMDVEEDLRIDFTCPYCDEEFDIASLCSHLEEEHCYDGKLTMCPVCAVKVGNDVVGHISAQHAHLFKIPRRRRFRKPRDFSANIQALLGTMRPASTSSDSFISTLVSAGFPTEEPLKSANTLSDIDGLSSSKDKSTEVSNSLESTLTHEEREKRRKEAMTRAKFMQDLVLSTLFPDD